MALLACPSSRAAKVNLSLRNDMSSFSDSRAHHQLRICSPQTRADEYKAALGKVEELSKQVVTGSKIMLMNTQAACHARRKRRAEGSVTRNGQPI